MMIGVAINSPRMEIPPGLESFTIESTCRLKLRAPVKVISYAHHAHKLGVKIEAELIRDGKVVAPLGTEDPYDFDWQRYIKRVCVCVFVDQFRFMNSKLPIVRDDYQR